MTFQLSFSPLSNGATLEWIRNETVIQRSPSTTATSLHLSLVSIGFSDAGQYLCRARLSGGETEGPVNAGYLSVLGRCAYNSFNCHIFLHVHTILVVAAYLNLTIQQTAYCKF